MENKIKRMSNIAAIATIYFVVSLSLQFMSFNMIQVRIAEVLIVVAIISIDGIYGVSLGCFITNSIGVMMGFSGYGVLDIIFGTLLTIISAILAYYFRNKKVREIPLLSLMMPVVINAIGLPIVFAFAFHQGFSLIVYLMEFFFIFVGQFISCVLFGVIVYDKLALQLDQYLN